MHDYTWGNKCVAKKTTTIYRTKRMLHDMIQTDMMNDMILPSYHGAVPKWLLGCTRMGISSSLCNGLCSRMFESCQRRYLFEVGSYPRSPFLSAATACFLSVHRVTSSSAAPTFDLLPRKPVADNQDTHLRRFNPQCLEQH